MHRRICNRLTAGAAALVLTAAVAVPVAAQTKLLRFPDIHGDRVVFSYAGDLWTASTGGGTASRLTAHPGLELFPRFSPDGSRIAFTGQYDGDEQVYVVPGLGRGAAAAHVLSRARSAGAALGLRQPGLRLVPRRAGGAVPVAPLQHRPLRQPPLPGIGRRRTPRSAADARVRRRRSVARRLQCRLLSLVPRLPDLEALRGRLGAGALHLRSRDARRGAHHDAPARRPRPDVDRQRHLFHVGPGRDAQSLPLRHRLARDDAAHRQRHVGRPLAGRRQREPHRLRAERRAADLHDRRRDVAPDRNHGAGRRLGDAAVACGGGRPDRRRRAEPRRGSGRCSWRAATSSRPRSRTDRRAT